MTILANAMIVTGYMVKRKKYTDAIEAIADKYAELVEDRIEKVYDVEITRKSTAIVVTDSEDGARVKALDGLDINDGEAVTAEVHK